MNFNSDQVFKVPYPGLPSGRHCRVVCVSNDEHGDDTAVEIQFSDRTTAIVKAKDLIGPLTTEETRAFHARLYNSRGLARLTRPLEPLFDSQRRRFA